MTIQKIATNHLSRVSLRDGQSMPWLGLGVWETPEAQTADVVRQAVKLGYQAVDTARLYKNEAGVGEGLAEHPNIFVTTKLWNDDQGYDSTLRAFEKSARLLKRDVVDLYLIHWPMPRQGQYVESWKALIHLQKEGRIRSIGVSNFEEEHLVHLMDETGVVPVINQIELHPYFQQRSLRAFHAKHRIQTEAWRPLGKGVILGNSLIQTIAQKYKRSSAQVILRWHLQNEIVVIPKSVNPERLAQNLDIFDFTLSREDMEAIATLDRSDGRMGEDPQTVTFK
ncbi:aldo/keto reductase [Saccharibacter sp. 17.LH.SD]|uniref:aldo/keto reductase n=1 Tax=Saccharibacter sp. 17.LH.SD TaxID=2689393 RepID=UPI00136EC506|nr:aldo/keto reductase [Saccharibacter sp. 17.LH.SD]MXV43828.1 aldo/keto reductase [Saccharibacter sp. 17.LH.SD]